MRSLIIDGKQTPAQQESEYDQYQFINLVNLQKMVLPVKLRITETNGTVSEVNFPLVIWLSGGDNIYTYHSTNQLRSVVVDPDWQLPDVNPLNNSWSK
jgi:hypothetical protein